MLSRPAAISRSITCGTGSRDMPRQVDHFRRRQRVQLERRIALLHRAEQILVPLERQVGIVAALQQQLHAAERDRLVDLPEDLLEAEDVAFGRADRPVERAEVAARDADVRVVDVAVDDVGDDRRRDACARGCRRRAGRAAASARCRYSSSASARSSRPPVADLRRELCQSPCLVRIVRNTPCRRRHAIDDAVLARPAGRRCRSPAASRSPSVYWILSLK